MTQHNSALTWLALIQSEVLSRSESAALWKQAGVRDARRADTNLRAICATSFDREAFAKIIGYFFETLRHSPDPDDALNQFERITAAVPSKANLFRNLSYFPPAFDLIMLVCSRSQYLTDIVVRDIGVIDLFYDLGFLKRIKDALVYDRDIKALLQLHHSDESRLRGLRFFKRREFFRIALQDLSGQVDFWTCVQELSHMADAMIRHAAALAEQQLHEHYGLASSHYVVLGMGKLGGEELNYSSDIDLVVVYERIGETQGPTIISNGEYYSKLVEKIIYILSIPNDQGSVYRVDMELRPWGSKSDLAHSLDSFYVYWDKYVEIWERQAFIKARPIAGDLGFGEQVLQRLRPLVFMDPLPDNLIAKTQQNKRLVEQHSADQNRGRINVKTDPGGIRDIEFSVQLLQLVFGAGHSEIQVPGTRAALVALRQAGIITPEEAEQLREAYVFLRRVEHMLQMMSNQQIYHLPVQKAAREQIGIRLGFSPGSFDEVFKQTGAKVRHLFNELFFNRVRLSQKNGDTQLALLTQKQPATAKLNAWLKPYGFVDTALAYRDLKNIRGEEERSHRAFAALLQNLLRACQQALDPDRALSALESFIAAYGQRHALLQTLGGAPTALNFLLHFFGLGPFFSRLLIAHPEWLDLFAQPTLVQHAAERYEILAELAAASDDTVFQKRLVQIKNRETLRIGLRHRSGVISWPEVFGELSYLADFLVLAAAHYASQSLGLPAYGENTCALALGKWGSKDLGFFSDLDVVLLYRSSSNAEDEQQKMERWAALVYKLVSSKTEGGQAYELDGQIRPEGSKGVLNIEVSRFAKYMQTRAEFWEWQSLLKARVVGNCPWAEAMLQQLFCDYIFKAERQRALRDNIKVMKQRIQDERAALEPAHFKLGKGGLVCLEFLLQSLQIQFSTPDKHYRGLSFLQSVQQLRADRHISQVLAQGLSDNYLWLRKIIQYLRFLEPHETSAMPKEKAFREQLAKAMGYGSAAELVKAFGQIKKQDEKLFGELA